MRPSVELWVPHPGGEGAGVEGRQRSAGSQCFVAAKPNQLQFAQSACAISDTVRTLVGIG